VTTPDNTPPAQKEWTESERASLRKMLRYGVAIFIAISVTLIIVGVLQLVLSQPVIRQ